jgi:hypothetical protein
MTLMGHDFTFSRREAPGVLHFVGPLENRGRREDRMRAAPAVSRAIDASRMRTRAYRFSGEPPAFPAQWLYDLYVVVLVTGFLATIAGRLLRQLDASTGASDPHDFVVRSSSFVLRATAPTATCPTSATMANAPLEGQDSGSHRNDLPDETTGIFLHAGIDSRPKSVSG